MVDYQRLKNDSRFKELITQLEAYPLERLEGPNERLAFYLNAYNILSINMVLNNWPSKSLRSLGNMVRLVWGRTRPADWVARRLRCVISSMRY